MSPRRTPKQLLIQIDGLSRRTMERALEQNTIPAVARLVRSEEYRVVTVFTGLPSTTPAVQGELFYGVRSAVPTFAFVDDDHRARSMLEPGAADRVQRRLERDHVGLLESGSSYCNIYTAGAVTARYCPVSLARPEVMDTRGPLRRLRSLGAHAGAVVRSMVMLAGEILRQFFSGDRPTRTPFLTRVKDLGNRIILSVVLRDRSRLAAENDLRRGLPVVHVNFLGYDKQAHRYGPESPPAMRALKGLDRAIGSLVDTAVDTAHRVDGDPPTIVVYSDHGQEASTPIDESAGRSISAIVREAVAAELAQERSEPNDHHPPRHEGVKRTLTERLGRVVLGAGAEQRDASVPVTTMQAGPVANAYLHRGTTRDQRIGIARRIARAAEGLVAVANDEETGPAACIGDHGPLTLAELCRDHLVDHPFAELIPDELDSLCRHQDAGDLVLFGTGFTDTPLAFAPEHGSHGGPGPVETRAFAVVPRSLPLSPEHETGPLRFTDLRNALLADRNQRDDQ